MKEIPKM